MRESKIINILLLILLVTVCVHERYLQRAFQQVHPAMLAAHRYTDNPHYYEETDFGTLYHSQPVIVMMGNSLIRKIDWNELLGRCDIVNRGVNVDVTEGMLHRIDKVIALKPKIVFVEGGINDIDFGVPIVEIAGNIGKIAEGLRAAGIIPVLTAVNHVNSRYQNSTAANANISSLNHLIAQMAVEKDIELIDLNPVIAPHDTLEHLYARGDGCHLTSNAYAVWLQRIESVLKAHGI